MGITNLSHCHSLNTNERYSKVTDLKPCDAASLLSYAGVSLLGYLITPHVLSLAVNLKNLGNEV